MNRCASQRPVFATQITACALIPLLVSGCSLFGSANSFSSLLQSNALPQTASESDHDVDSTDTAPTDELSSLLKESALAGANDKPISPQSNAPSGRLLSPEFPVVDAGNSESTGGHSFATANGADSQSQFSTKIQSVSQTRELFDPPNTQQPEASGARSVQSMERTVDSMAVTPPQSETAESSGLAASPVSVETRVAEAPQQSASSTPPERSMLERLRGFAPDGRTGNLLRRQIQRIPSPWDLFPGREPTEEPPREGPAEKTTAELQPVPPPVDIDFSTADTTELLNALISTLERELETWPQTENGLALQPEEYRRRQLNLRLLRLIDDEPAAAAEAIDLMSPEEQEFWQELILGISRFRSPADNSDYEQHIADTIGQLKQAVQQLEPLSRLRIRRIDFCTSIEHFGAFETFPSNTFEPAQRLLIYAEVENLQAEVSPPPLNSYRTSFTSKLEIWSDEPNAAEQPLESWPIETVHEDSSTRRSDYFQSYEFTLPPHLAQGKYEIRLQVHDDISGRTAHATLKFVVQ